MKTLKIILLTMLVLFFAQCKTAAPTASNGPTPSLFEVVQILDSTQSEFFAYSALNNGNAHQAIMQTAVWVQSQPNVQSVTTLDSVSIKIILKSGLHTAFTFDETDSAGYSITHGGRPDPSKVLTLSRSGILSMHSIENKRVLLYLAAYKEFFGPGRLQTILNYFSNSPELGLDVTVLKDADCTYQTVGRFGDYGLVLIDTHGGPDEFMIGTRVHIDNTIVSDDLFKASIVAQGGQDMLNKLLSGELSFHDRVKGNSLFPYWKQVKIVNLYLNVTTKYIDALPAMPGTIIYSGTCFGGQTAPVFGGGTPIQTAWVNRNLISYYSYAYSTGLSELVNSPICEDMIDTLVQALIRGDSTGNAYLQSDHTQFFDPLALLAHPLQKLYFEHSGADNYGYSQCGDTLLDTRDGQKYSTVCLGDQVWMAQNLNFNAPGSHCYQDVGSNCDTFGRFYNWSTLMQGAAASSANPSGVQGVCPKGWHVPSVAEWTQLINFFGGQFVAGTALKDTILWQTYTPKPSPGTNISGFSALPAGAANSLVKPPWSGIGITADFGTASSDPSNPNYPYFWMGLQWGNASAIVAGTVMPTMESSCRCVKDP